MRLLKQVVKNILHTLISGKKDHSTLKVLSGPAKGTIMKIDLRKEGSYFIGNYDRWIFDRMDLSKYIKPGMVIWDCGAYIGYYTAVFRRIIGNSGHVYTFEGSSNNFKIVNELPALNQWNNVTVIHCAVGPDHSKISFSNNLGGSNGPVGMSKEYSHKLEIEEVQCCGMDELVYEQLIPAPDFIKFDLESAEEFALHNGEKLFTYKKPLLLLELHTKRAVEAAGRFLEKYNYKASLVGDMPNPVKYYTNGKELTDLDYIPHMIFCEHL